MDDFSAKLREWPELDELIPLLSSETRDALAEDIRVRQQLVPILCLPDGRVIDGRNRLQIVRDLNREPLYQILGMSDDAAMLLAGAMATKHRQISREQLKEMVFAYRRKKTADHPGGFTQAEASEATGVPEGTIAWWEADAKPKGKRDDESIIGPKNAFIPDQRVSLPASAKPVIAERIAKGETKAQVAADFGVTQQRVGQVAKQAEARAKVVAALPPAVDPMERHYKCIVADPPWPMAKVEREERPDQGKRLDYPTMKMDEIKALGKKVKKWAHHDGCYLFMWTTQKFLPELFGDDGVLAAWGAKYQCVGVWAKGAGITPFSWHYDVEFWVFARIGRDPGFQKVGESLVITGGHREHSRKPEAFYEKVLRVAQGPRLEMFAREQREGFDVWGNQTEHFSD